MMRKLSIMAFFILPFFTITPKTAHAQVLDSLEMAKLVKQPDNIIRTELNKISIIADELFGNGKYKEAASITEQQLEILEDALGKNDSLYCFSLGKLGLINKKLGHFEEALRIYQDALDYTLHNLGKRHIYYGTCLTNLGALYRSIGRYEAALSLFRQALEHSRNSYGTEHASYGKALNNLGNLHKEMGLYDVALPLLLEALVVTCNSVGKEHPDYATRLNNLGGLYQSIGRFDQALPLLLESLEATGKISGKEHPDYGMRLNNLGGLYEAMGRYDDALPLHLEAIENCQNSLGKAHMDYGIRLVYLGLLYKKMGRFDEALPLYMEALKNAEKSLGKEHPFYGIYLNNLGVLLESMGRYDEALSFHLEALENCRNSYGERHKTYGSYLSNLGNLYESMGRFDEALPLLLEALEITRNRLGKDHPDYGIRLTNLGGVYESLDQFQIALEYILEANANWVKQIDNVFTVSSERNKADFLKTLTAKFAQNESFGITIDYQFDTLKKLIYNNALHLNRLILESTTNTYAAIESSNDTSLVNQLKNWKILREDLAKQYSKPITKRTINADSLEQVANNLEGKLVRLSSDFAQTRRQIMWQDVQKALSSNEIALEFSSFRYMNGRLKTDSIMYTVMLLTPESEAPTIIPLFEQKQLDTLLGKSQGKTDEQYLSQLYTGRGGVGVSMTSNDTASSKLHQLIWKPIEKHLEGVERIYMAPSGKLHQVALHALPDDQGELMLNKYDLRYVNSTRMLVTGKKTDASRKIFHAYGGINYHLSDTQWKKAVMQYLSDEALAEDPLAALGFIVEEEPEYATDARSIINGNSWSQLKGTLTEVNIINKLLSKKDWKTQNYTGELALEEAIKNNTGKLAPDVLHIATHGFFFPDVEETEGKSVYRQSEDPMFRSGLIMAGGNRDWQQEQLPKGVENGVLTAYEVAQLDLRNTDLVVLSACETGLGDIKGSEGVYGLQRAFKQAGADYIIISLWKVPDKQTVELMEAFYKYWHKGQPIPQAFRKAQLKMSKKYTPYEWAAFKLVR